MEKIRLSRFPKQSLDHFTWNLRHQLKLAWQCTAARDRSKGSTLSIQSLKKFHEISQNSLPQFIVSGNFVGSRYLNWISAESPPRIHLTDSRNQKSRKSSRFLPRFLLNSPLESCMNIYHHEYDINHLIDYPNLKKRSSYITSSLHFPNTPALSPGSRKTHDARGVICWKL